MDTYKPSWFDQILQHADKLLQRGYAIVTGEEPYDFDQRLRQQEMVPIRLDDRARRGKHPAVRRAIHRPF